MKFGKKISNFFSKKPFFRKKLRQFLPKFQKFFSKLLKLKLARFINFLQYQEALE
jgi:hypothetical protein